MAATYVKTSGSFAPVLQPYIKTSGTWTPVLSMWVKTGGTWTLTWSGFTASASPDTMGGLGSFPTVLSDSAVIVTTSGGVGPFTYAWTQVSGDAIDAAAPTNANSFFQATLMSPGETRIAVYRCSVTDTTTSVIEDTNDVTITISRTP